MYYLNKSSTISQLLFYELPRFKKNKDYDVENANFSRTHYFEGIFSILS